MLDFLLTTSIVILEATNSLSIRFINSARINKERGLMLVRGLFEIMLV